MLIDLTTAAATPDQAALAKADAALFEFLQARADLAQVDARGAAELDVRMLKELVPGLRRIYCASFLGDRQPS